MKRYIHIPVALALGAVMATALESRPAPEISIVQQAPKYEEASKEFFSRNEARQIAWELLTEKSFECIDYIFIHESNWRSKAKNKQSTAKGVGQLLDGTYKNLGMKHTDDPRAQVIAALAYIGRKYGAGGPCAAKKHWLKHGWY